MIALLSALLGFFTSAAPKMFESFQDRRDKAHELEMMKLQIQQGDRIAQSSLDQSLLQAEAAMYTSAQQSYQREVEAEERVGNTFILGLGASVRPIITYAFFLLYAGVKVAMWQSLLHPTLPWQTALTSAQALVAIWGEEDMALFSAVICFWFGNRLFRNKA